MRPKEEEAKMSMRGLVAKLLALVCFLTNTIVFLYTGVAIHVLIAVIGLFVLFVVFIVS